MNKTILILMTGVVVVGAGLYFLVSNSEDAYDIVLTELDSGEQVNDSVVGNCRGYSIGLGAGFENKGQAVKWQLGEGVYTHGDAILEEISFDKAGATDLVFYVEGREKARRTIYVEECPGVILSLPMQVTQSESHTFIDKTPDALSRRWYVKNSKSSRFVEYDDNDGQLRFKFSFTGTYVLRVEVETTDSTYTKEHTWLVKKKKVKGGGSNIGGGSGKGGTTGYDDDIDEVDDSVADVNPPIVTGNPYFGKKYEVSEPTWSSSTTSDWFHGEEACFNFNDEAKTIVLRDLTNDICITDIYIPFLADSTSNSVYVSVEAVEDIGKEYVKRPKKRSLSRRSDSQFEAKVPMGSQTCYLREGKSYRITIAPQKNSRVGELNMSSSCIDAETIESFPYAEINIPSETKIIGFEYRVRE